MNTKEAANSVPCAQEVRHEADPRASIAANIVLFPACIRRWIEPVSEAEAKPH